MGFKKESLVDRGARKENGAALRGRNHSGKKAIGEAGAAVVPGVAGRKVVSAVKPDGEIMNTKLFTLLYGW